MAVRMAVDLLVLGSDGRPIAAVEVKNLPDLSPDVAVELRRSLVEHGAARDAPYFLLVSQDRGFLWQRSEDDGLDARPNVEFPMSPAVARYLSDTDASASLRGDHLEFIVLHWLIELAGLPQEAGQEPERSLAATGFLDAIRGATVTRE